MCAKNGLRPEEKKEKKEKDPDMLAGSDLGQREILGEVNCESKYIKTKKYGMCLENSKQGT